MNHINRIGIDLVKNVFQVCALDHRNQVLFNKKLNRKKFILFMAKLPVSKVYMEACYSSHYWGRTLREMGHSAYLIPAQHVKSFERGNKNDNNDALAVAEAANRPNFRFVPIKTVEQQEIMVMHRLRSRLIKSRTQLSNQQLSASFRQLMLDMNTEFKQISERIETIENSLQVYIKQTNHCAVVSSIPGIGFINASALVASIDKGQAFNNPREFAVWLGLTPSQYASDEKTRNGRITKLGDRYLRTQLIHGARAAKKWARKRDDQLSLWIKQLEVRVGKNKATVAIAHRLARLVWILLQKQQLFAPLYPQLKVQV